MTKIKEILKEMEPYVISIRFIKGVTVVDTVFKEGWEITESEIVGAETLDDKPNYYMLYPMSEDAGLDDMLDYIKEIIAVNVEREEKLLLLRQKVNELQQLFTSTPLSKCKTLTFNFGSKVTENSESLTLDDMPLYNAPKTKKNKAEVEPTKPSVVTVTDNTVKAQNQMVDLPPKKGQKIEVAVFDEPKVVCKCGPNEICPVCEADKM